MARGALPYVGIDPAWEAQQLRAFQHLQRNGATHGSFADFLCGRLLEEDLHVSCMPMLPPHVDQLHGMTIQGMCILQIVDIVNIGANFEHRKEDAKGQTRTLKLCFTDGHQLVFGFEAQWLPTFSLALLHGTKVAITNVAVRHGLLQLTPLSCRLLGESNNDQLEQVRKSVVGETQATSASDGAYAAALKTTQFADALLSPVAIATTTTIPMAVVPSIRPPPVRPPALPLVNGTAAATPSRPPPAVLPPVFVDVVSSDDDCDSDATDPTVQHLFYSPNTPRLPASPSPQSPLRRTQSRKRPRDATAMDANVRPVPVVAPMRSPAAALQPTATVLDDDDMAVDDYDFNDDDLLASDAFSFALLNAAKRPQPLPSIDLFKPFQYFTAAIPSLSASHLNHTTAKDDVVRIRACIKSVAGFQFTTGTYMLEVVVEDCSCSDTTRTVAVDAAFVETLMGVSCAKFLHAMQQTPRVAHQWAARMQFALMTLEGVMTFRRNPNGTFTLMTCRDVTLEDAQALLARVTQAVGEATTLQTTR